MKKDINKGIKALWIATAIILSVAFALAFIGSVLMFLDYGRGLEYDYYSKTYKYSYNYYPETGVMPFIGTIVFLAGYIMYILSKKKNVKLSIGTIVCSVVSSLLLYLSVIFPTDTTAFIGWILCCTGAAIINFCIILEIVYLAVSLSTKKRDLALSSNDSDGKSKYNYSKLDYCVKTLKELKMLLNESILTEIEFQNEKQKILQSTGLVFTKSRSSNIDGEYTSDNSTIIILDNSFAYRLINSEVVKTGDVAFDETNSVLTLFFPDNKEVTFVYSGRELVSNSGISYKRK